MAGENAGRKTGVFPCYENMFQAGEAKDTATDIKDMESFSVSFDNGVEEWYTYGEEGWVNRLMTAKGIKISIKGKRNLGDPGNDYVAGKAFMNGMRKDILGGHSLTARLYSGTGRYTALRR